MSVVGASSAFYEKHKKCDQRDAFYETDVAILQAYATMAIAESIDKLAIAVAKSNKEK